MKSSSLFIALLFFSLEYCFGQTSIHTKEGRAILNYRSLITNCVKSFNKDKTDKTVLAICECQVSKLDYHFTNKQYKQFTSNGSIDIAALVKEDTAFEKEFQACFVNSGQTMLLQAEGFEKDYLSNCIKNLQSSTEKSLDPDRLSKFCNCQLELVKQKKLTDSELETLTNPNSVLFYEMMYKCGSPFDDGKKEEQNWNPQFANDITGPVGDTLDILTLNGLTYIKIKVGSLIQIWLFDTGASDLLINKEMETLLKEQNIMNEKNYIGIGEYEMANGMIDACRKYRINDVQIGNFHVNNVIVAVTDKGKRIIVGKALLNKFREWNLNNKKNALVLTR
jgi:hypothetical protein